MKKEFKIISDLILKNSRVLDVGCGDGELMSFLFENITQDIRGIEISKTNNQKVWREWECYSCLSPKQSPLCRSLERKFEISRDNMVVGFTSKGCF